MLPATPWSDATLAVPVLPAMTRPCAWPDERDALATPWSARWERRPAAVPAPRVSPEGSPVRA